MKHDYDDERDLDEDAPALSSNPFDRARRQGASPDPHDDGLDDSFLAEDSFLADDPFLADDAFDDDDYGEPERDTVLSGGSTEVYYEEEEGIDDLFDEESGFEDEPASEAPTLTLVEDEPDLPDEEDGEPKSALETGAEPDEWPTTGAAAGLAAARWREDATTAGAADDDDWQDDDDEFLEDDDNAGPPWPFGLIAVAVLALVLLIAGGYGVIQQRQATEEEIRQLRSELATAASPADVSASREALQDMKAQNEELSRQVANLTLYNRRLTDTVAGLEAQLDAQQAVLAKARPDTPAPEAAAPKPAPAAKQAPAPVAKTPAAAPAAASPTGDWFVNFGSYGQEAIAREWAERLNPGSGEAMLVTATVEGRTLYRVRVVGLNDRDSAERVARDLETRYDLPKLWVGKQ